MPRAKASTSKRAAPARFRTRAQASTVAPVVMTSFTTTTDFPAMILARDGDTLKAPATLCLRWAAYRPTWLAVRRTLRSTKQSARIRVSLSSPCASNAD